MTLNTFHFAGRGEANVTLGIPRLRELLMAAAKKLATPVMTLPLLPHAQTMEQAENLARRLRRVRLAELIRRLSVTENPCGTSHSGTGKLARTYTVSMQLRGPKTGEDDDDDDDASADDVSDDVSDDDAGEDDDGKVSFAQMAKSFRRDFAKRLYGRIKLELRRVGANAGRIEVSKAERADRGATGGGGDDDDDAERAVKSKKDDKEDGEDASDDEDEEDEEGAKTEDRKDARGDDGEGFTDADAKEKREKLAHVKTVKTEGEVKAAEDGDGDAMDEESDSDSDSDSGSDSGSGSGSGSGSEDDDGDDAAGAREEPKKKPKAPAKPRASSRSVGGDLLESLEDIVETVTVDRETRTCVLTLSLKLTAPQLLVLELCEKVASETIVRSVPGIDKTYVVGKLPSDDPTGKDPLRIQTDGVNFAAAWANDDLVDCTKLTTNDVYAMLQTYGVEAARQTLVQEVRNVFGVYGIGVDARHLTLIADFMMQQGNYRPCSRAGIETSPSPFLKMSYETAAAFLVDATMKGAEDTLESPSSRIVMGRVPDLGTGSFGLRYDMNKAAKMQEECRKEARG